MIAAALMIRNEAPDLLEWLAYHYLLGVERFIVYDNESTDDTPAVLRRAQANFDLDVVPWPTFPRRLTQVYAYRDACFRLRWQSEVDWCAFIDADEFLVSADNTPIEDLVERCRAASAISLNWAVFGSNGHLARPPGLVIESFQRRAPLLDACNRIIKSIVRPRAVLDCLNPHFFQVAGETVDADGAPVAVNENQSAISGEVRACSWRINHYATRSRWHWDRRLSRGQAGNIAVDEDRWRVWNRNDELDTAAAFFNAGAVHVLLDKMAPVAAET